MKTGQISPVLQLSCKIHGIYIPYYFADSINEEGTEEVDLRIVCIPDLSSEQFEMTALRKEERMKGDKKISGDSSEEESENSKIEEKNPVQTKRLYHIAESFIQLIGELTG